MTNPYRPGYREAERRRVPGIGRGKSDGKKGTPIIELDREFFKNKDIDLTTPMIVTNGEDMEIEIFAGKRTEKGSTVVICCRN